MTQYVKPTLKATLEVMREPKSMPTDGASVSRVASRLKTFLEERYERDLPYCTIVNHRDPFAKRTGFHGTPDLEILQHGRPAVGVLVGTATDDPVKALTSLHDRAVASSSSFAHVICLVVPPCGYKRKDDPELDHILGVAKDKDTHFIVGNARPGVAQ